MQIDTDAMTIGEVKTDGYASKKMYYPLTIYRRKPDDNLVQRLGSQ